MLELRWQGNAKMASKAENCRTSISSRIFDNVIASWTFCVEQFFISKVDYKN